MRIDCITEKIKTDWPIKVAVAGDFCLDKYLYIEPDLDEPSLETGLVAYQIPRCASYAGAAGTISNNLASLGVQVICVGIVGCDGSGYELMEALANIGADTRYMIHTSRRCTSTYTKPMRDGVELNRFDIRNFTPTPADIEDKLIENMEKALSEADAMIICDQFTERNLNAITDRVRDAIPRLSAGAPNKFILADSRGFINEFRGVTVKCNMFEAVRSFYGEMSAEEITDEMIEECGMRLSTRNSRPAIITGGERGMWVFDGRPDHIPGLKVEGPFDFCGAGDSVNAGFTFGIASGMDYTQAAVTANSVASLTIQQIGTTGKVTRAELLERIKMYEV